MEWKPIETAPLDKPILGWDVRYREMLIFEIDKGFGPIYWESCGVEYWMPLPPPPKDAHATK